MSEIIPCPYCGSDEVTTRSFPDYHNDDPQDDLWAVHCPKCHAWGASKDTEAAAVAAWNEVAGMRKEIDAMRNVLVEINIWCGTDDGAYALPFEPPWNKALLKAISRD